MKKTSLWLFRAAMALGALGWLALLVLGAECIFFLEPDDDKVRCFATAITLQKFALLPATVLSLVAFVWLTRRQQNVCIFGVIIPYLILALKLS
ncbi:hypothetical protein EGJ29_09615 [Pseudomonas sp. s199]|nr:hypothetical protein EGJ29_09615 [Pseudomonas sp. s199]